MERSGLQKPPKKKAISWDAHISRARDCPAKVDINFCRGWSNVQRHMVIGLYKLILPEKQGCKVVYLAILKHFFCILAPNVVMYHLKMS